MKKTDLLGRVYGKLTVTQPHSRDRNGHARWECVCECGKVKVVAATHLVSGKTRSCGCGIPRGKERKQWRGYEEISGQVWNQIVRGADGSKGRRAIPFNLTIEQVWDLYEQQGRLCALSGLPIYFAARFNDSQTASLDRIDSSKGYVIDNVQWVHKDINKMKNSYDQNYFVSLCKAVAVSNVF